MKKNKILKKLFLLIAFAGLLSGGGGGLSYAQQWVRTGGNWNSTTQSGYAFMSNVSTYYHYTWTQTPYSAYELGGTAGAGYIGAIGLDNRSTTAMTIDTLRIYLGPSTDTIPSSTSAWIAQSNLKLVYTGVNVTIPATTAEYIFTLDSLYHYTGGHLAVVVSKKVSGTVSTTCRFGYQSRTNSILYRGTNTSALSTNTTYANHPGTNTGVRSSYRANVKFYFSPTNTFLARAGGLHVTSVTHDSIYAAWTVKTGQSYQVGFAPAGTCSDPATLTLQTNTTGTVAFGNLTPNTRYTIYVRGADGAGNFSQWDSLIAATSPIATALPYTTDFESSADDGDWTFLNVEGSTTCNFWTIGGGAGANSSSRAMYISNDATAKPNRYSQIASYVSAAKLFSLPTAGYYDIAFDWRAQGLTTVSYMRALLVPAMDIDFYNGGTAAKTGLTYQVSPAGVIPIDANKRLNLDSNWTRMDTTVLVSTPGNYYLLFYWANTTANLGNPPAAIDNIDFKVSTCSTPIAVSVTSTDTTSVTLNINHASASHFLVKYRQRGSTGEWESEEVYSTTCQLTNLLPSMEYDAQVYTLCGSDTSKSQMSLTFATDCGTARLPWSYGAEGYWNAITTTGSSQYCWTNLNGGSTTYGWRGNQSTSYVHSGAKALHFYGTTTASYVQDDWLITPKINFEGREEMTLWMRASSASTTEASHNRFAIYATNPGMEDSTSRTAFYRLQISGSDVVNNYVDRPAVATYTLVTLNLPTTLTGVHRLAFVVDTLSNVFYMDDIDIYHLSSCATPLDFTRVSYDTTSVVLRWRDTAHVSNYVVRYFPSDSGENSSAVNTTYVTDTTATITGLMPDVVYTFQVAAVCSGEQSNWTRTIEQRTACLPIATALLPYRENFESYNTGYVIGSCWRKGTNSTTAYPSISSIDGTKTLYFFGSTTAWCYAAMPMFEANVSDLTLQFSMRRNNTPTNTKYIILGLMTNPDDINTLTIYDTIVPTVESGWEIFQIPLTRYNQALHGRNIAFYNPMGAINYLYIDDIKVFVTPTCGAMTQPSVNSISYNEVSVSWTDTNSPNNQYRILVGEAGFNPDTMTTYQTATGQSYTIQGLLPNHSYDFYVEADCGDGSMSVSPAQSFTTACSPQSVPFRDDFDSYVSGSTSVMTCWNKGLVGNYSINYPYPYSYNSISGNSLYFCAYWTTSGTQIYSSYASMPMLSSDLRALQVRFKMKNHSTMGYYTPEGGGNTMYYASHLILGVTVNPNDMSTFDTIAVFDMDSDPINTIRDQRASLAGYTGQGRYITFLVPNFTGFAGYNYNYCTIDSLVVDSLPACQWPVALNAQNVTPNSATLNWTANGSEYIVEYSEGQTLTNPTRTTATTNSLALSNLNNFSYYTFRVRGICNVGGVRDTGEWSETKTFLTAMDCGTHTQTRDTLLFGTTYSSMYTPFASSNYHSTKVYELFSQATMASMGLTDTTNIIRSMSVQTGDRVTGRPVPMRIYMSEYDDNSFHSMSDTLPLSTMQLVYDGYHTFTSEEWNELVLSTPFNYSGDKSLVVAFVRDTVFGTQGYTYLLYGATNDTTMLCYSRYATNNPSGYTVKNLYNTIFRTCRGTAVCDRPTYVSGTPEQRGGNIRWTGTSPRYIVMLSDEQVDPIATLMGESGADVTLDTVTTTSYHFTNLTSGKTYYYWVRSLCNDGNGLWAAMGTLRVPCAPVSLPYYENFDNYPAGTSAAAGQTMNSCWTRNTNYAQNIPYVYTTRSYSVPNSMYFYSASTVYCYVAFPEVNDSIHNLMMSMKVYKATASHGRFRVGVMTDPNDLSTFHVAAYVFAPTINTWNDIEIDLSNYRGPEGHLAIYCPDSIGQNFQVDDIRVYVHPTCVRPTNLTAGTTTATTVPLSWTGNSTAGYDVQYGPQGFSVDNNEGTTIHVTGTTATLTGLQSGTNYDAYVRATCSATDSSFWSAGTSFTTQCAPISLPVIYDFEDYATGTSAALPLCWNRFSDATNTSASYANNPFVQNNNTGNYSTSGTKYLYYNLPITASYPNNEIMIFPEIDTNQVPMHQVEVILNAKCSTAVAKFVVGVMSNPTNLNTFTPIDTLPLTSTFATYNVPLTRYTGTGTRVALRAMRGTSNDYIYVDDVILTRQSACPRVLSVTALSATNTSMRITWNDTINSTRWLVKYKPVNGTTETVVGANTDTITLSNLTAATVYDIWVAPICSSGDTGAYMITPGRYRTAQTPATMPYTYDFEDANEWRNWETASNNFIGFYRGNVARGNSTNSLYLSLDGGRTHGWNLYRVTNAVAYRDIDFGPDTGSFQISFDAYIGGSRTENYEGLSIIDGGTDLQNIVVSSNNQITSPWGNINDVEMITTRHDTLWGTHTGYVDNIAGVHRIAIYTFGQNTGTNYPYDNNPPAIDNLRIIPQPCLRPTDLSYSNLTVYSADMAWTGDSVATYILFRRDGNNATQYDTVIGTSFTYNDLDPATSYNVWVRTMCADTLLSGWSDYVSFRTDCAPLVAGDTIREGFETTTAVGFGSAGGKQPTCWSYYYTGTSTTGAYPNYYPHVISNTSSYSYIHSGTKSMLMTVGSNTGSRNYLILPEFFEPTNSLTMSFWMYTSTLNTAITVGYLTSADESGFVPVATFDADSSTLCPTNSSEYGLQPASRGKLCTVRFDTVQNGNFPVVIRVSASNVTTLNQYVNIDDVTITSSITCLTPRIEAIFPSYSSAAVRGFGPRGNYQVVTRDQAGLHIDTTYVTSPNFNLTGLLPSTIYSMQIRKVCDNGQYSDWASNTFVTTAYTCMPVDTLSVSDVSYNAATLTWEPSSNEQNKWVVAIVSGGRTIYDTVDNTTYTLSGLAQATPYEVTVMGLCFDELESQWTDTVSFTTLSCDTVSDINIVGVTHNKANISWYGTADRYELEYGETGFGTGQGQRVTTTISSYTITGLDEETTYDVFIRAFCDETNSSVWSSRTTFTTTNYIECDTVTNLSVDAKDTTATISWNGSATMYEIQYGMGDFTIGDGTPLTSNTNSIVLHSLEPHTAYRVFVRALCSNGGISDWVNTDFTTNNLGIEAADQVSVAIYPNPASTSTTLSITGANGMISITVIDLNGKALLSEETYCDSNCTTSLAIDNLSAGVYFVRVNGEGVNTVRKLVVK